MSNRDLEVEPRRVMLDHAGAATRRWVVRLPQAIATADDLKDPAIWRKVQDDHNFAFMRHDEVYCIAYAEDWAALSVVTDASRSSAVLAITKLITLGSRVTPLLNDGKYRVEWTGGGFTVVRISDGAKMSDELGSEALAVEAIRRLYPARVA